MQSQQLFQLSPFTVNLSICVLSDDEISLLDKGLSFIPSIQRVNLAVYQNYVDRLIRRIRLVDFFHDRNDVYDPRDFCNRFLAPSSWCPPAVACSKDTSITISSIVECSNSVIANNITSRGDALRVKSTANLTANEFTALRSLRSNADIVIKSADKGGSIVVMDKELYEAEALRQLNNPKYYKLINESVAAKNAIAINSIVNKLYDNNRISKRQHAFLICDLPVKNRYFYLLPKVHKPRNKWPHRRMPEGRPIVASCGSELSNVGKLIDYYLQPLVTTSDFYIKDTYHFISKVRGQLIDSHWYFITETLAPYTLIWITI